jgi:hypothetical protein
VVVVGHPISDHYHDPLSSGTLGLSTDLLCGQPCEWESSQIAGHRQQLARHSTKIVFIAGQRHHLELVHALSHAVRLGMMLALKRKETVCSLLANNYRSSFVFGSFSGDMLHSIREKIAIVQNAKHHIIASQVLTGLA